MKLSPKLNATTLVFRDIFQNVPAPLFMCYSHTGKQTRIATHCKSIGHQAKCPKTFHPQVERRLRCGTTQCLTTQQHGSYPIRALSSPCFLFFRPLLLTSWMRVYGGEMICSSSPTWVYMSRNISACETSSGSHGNLQSPALTTSSAGNSQWPMQCRQCRQLRYSSTIIDLLPLLSPTHGYILLTTNELQRYDLFFLSNLGIYASLHSLLPRKLYRWSWLTKLP